MRAKAETVITENIDLGLQFQNKDEARFLVDRPGFEPGISRVLVYAHCKAGILPG